MAAPEQEGLAGGLGAGDARVLGAAGMALVGREASRGLPVGVSGGVVAAVAVPERDASRGLPEGVGWGLTLGGVGILVGRLGDSCAAASGPSGATGMRERGGDG